MVKPHVTLGKGEYRKPAMQANCETSEKPVRGGIASCCVLCPVVGSFESPLSLWACIYLGGMLWYVLKDWKSCKLIPFKESLGVLKQLVLDEFFIVHVIVIYSSGLSAANKSKAYIRKCRISYYNHLSPNGDLHKTDTLSWSLPFLTPFSWLYKKGISLRPTQ